jgi:adenylate cyclase
MAATAQSNSGKLLKRLRKSRVAFVASLAVVLFAISCTEPFRSRQPVRDLAAMVHDANFQRKRGEEPLKDVVIVGITTSSLSAEDLQPLAAKSETVRAMSENTWPWPRPIHARVIEKLFEEGAKIVAVDIAMPSERDGDDELIAVMKKYAGRIVLASVIQAQPGRKELVFIHPRPEFLEAAGTGALGLVNFVPYGGDDSPIVRRYDSHTSEGREVGIDDGIHDIVHFAVRSAELYTGKAVPPRYNEIIPYRGRPGTFDYIPVEQIFMGADFKNGLAHFKNGEATFRDKLVFYGPIAEIMHDVHPTPLGTMPGVEIHAQLASSLIESQRIIDMGILHPATAHAASLAVTLLCAFLVLWLRNPLLQLAALGATLFGALEIGYAAFLGGVYFPAAPWLITGTFAGIGGITYSFILERMERAHVRKTFGRFVSKRIADVVLKNAEEFDHARAGERRAVAVLFSDIRSFTTWSENAAPENLVGQLNEYFEAMVPLVEDNEGNAQKFIGDAILAAWGDTHSNGHAEDCRRAVLAAMKMREALKTLNARWAGRDDRITISIGIGINHGTVVTGEVGQSERREFTVLGDGVNFAARLESATKQFHTDCLVGESVEALTREFFEYREVGFLRVKGKTKPVHIFTPLSEKGTAAPGWLGDYQRALELHRKRDFSRAAALFTEVKERAGGDDFLCDWYLDLGRRYLIDPPSESWDGSETLTEK